MINSYEQVNELSSYVVAETEYQLLLCNSEFKAELDVHYMLWISHHNCITQLISSLNPCTWQHNENFNSFDKNQEGHLGKEMKQINFLTSFSFSAFICMFSRSFVKWNFLLQSGIYFGEDRLVPKGFPLLSFIYKRNRRPVYVTTNFIFSAYRWVFEFWIEPLIKYLSSILLYITKTKSHRTHNFYVIEI